MNGQTLGLLLATVPLVACLGEPVGFHRSIEIRGQAEAFIGRVIEVDGQRAPAPAAFGGDWARAEVSRCSRGRAGFFERPLRVRVVEGQAIRSEVVVAARPCLGSPAGWREGLQERIVLVLRPDGALVAPGPGEPIAGAPVGSADLTSVGRVENTWPDSIGADTRRGYQPVARCEGPIAPTSKCGPRPCRTGRLGAGDPAPAASCVPPP